MVENSAMADKTAEQLSALMDGECPVTEIDLALRRLAKQTDLQARWQRYHLISDALKNNLPNSVDTGFSDRIRQTIEHTSIEFPVTKKPSSWYKPVAGFALAASLVGAILISVDFSDQNALDGQAVSTITPDADIVVAATTTNLASEADTPTALTTTQTPLPLHMQMMANHLEYASSNSVHGIVPYVSTVNFQSNR